MKVQLITHTENLEQVVAMSAKLCYSKVGLDAISTNLTPLNIEKFLTMLADMGHESPFEHANFTFAVEGVSRTLSHQLVRHRIASYSQQSQRYVKLEQFEYIVPPSINENERAKAIFIDAMKKDQEAYNLLVDSLMVENICVNYKKELGTVILQHLRETNQTTEADIVTLIDNVILSAFTLNLSTIDDIKDIYDKELFGLDILGYIALFYKEYKKEYSKVEKKAIEDARYVFPNACETKLVFTMNTRSLYNFLKHRCCERAQWEIRDLACAMVVELKRVAPILFKNVGPSCVTDKCGEGVMSCGMAKEVKEKFKNM